MYRVMAIWLLVASMVVAGCARGREAGVSGASASDRQYGKPVRASGGVYRIISVADLAQMLDSQDVTLVNVHIPYEGEIASTDAHIPFSEIEKHLAELPPDKEATIVLYCRIGVMSTDAARMLAKIGFTRVYELGGGMRAWQAAGYPVINRTP